MSRPMFLLITTILLTLLVSSVWWVKIFVWGCLGFFMLSKEPSDQLKAIGVFIVGVVIDLVVVRNLGVSSALLLSDVLVIVLMERIVGERRLVEIVVMTVIVGSQQMWLDKNFSWWIIVGSVVIGVVLQTLLSGTGKTDNRVELKKAR